jgi:signal transduction histidine kinase/ligand-binding sensor domain-containing protein
MWSFKNPKGFFSIFLLGLTLYAPSQQYNFREYSDGLAQPYVYSIIQDNNGYLWIGTGNGLSRYDGFNFKSFTTRDSLADNFITCSYKNGNDVWFGHINGKVSHYNGKTFTPVSLHQNSSITDIEKSPKGEIWASSFNNGLVKLDEKAGITQNANVNSQISIFSFQFLTDHEILVASVDGLNYCSLYKSGEIKIIRHVSKIPECKIQDIIKMRNGSGFYVATENRGICQLVPEGKQFSVSKIGAGLNLDISGIQSIFEDSESNLWISTFGSGLMKLVRSNSGQFNEATVFNKSTGFSTDHVKVAYEDREGNIWSGNYGTGLTQITKKSFSLYSFDEARYGTEIYSIYVHNNDRWLGTDKGLLKMDHSTGEILNFYSANDGLPHDKITAIFSNQSNELWIGTENNGVYRMLVDKEKFLPYKIGNGTLENSINTITGKDDQIWVGTKKGVCNINLNFGKIQWYTIDKGGLPHNYVNHVFIGSKGKVWVSTLSNILAFIQDGKVGEEVISSLKGIPSLGPICEENDSTIWVGSYGSGVFRIKSGTITNLTSKDGLLSDYCYSLVVDNDKNLWIGHRGGLSKIRLSDFLVKPIQQYAGIKSSCEFNKNAVFKDSKNRLLFGTDEGLWVYDPALEKQVSLPPALNITSIKVNDEEVDYHEGLVLPPGNYKIKIEYLGINLKEPALVNYQYQLEGYDQSPEYTKTTSVTYPHLNEGSYTFILKASTGDGVTTNSPLTISILIKTPVWKHWWFYVIVFLSLVFAVVFYIRRREYKLLIEKRMLETKVRERTAELAQKNSLLYEKQEEITAQNSELIKYRNYLEQLVDERTKELLKAKNKAEESDRLKTAFLQNMSHEIRTPMNGILGFLGLLQEPDLETADKNHYIDIMKESGQRLLHTINDIIEISRIESAQIVIHYAEVNIMEIMDIHLHFFKLQAEKKGLQLKLSAQIQGEKAMVETDKNILNGILTNLINNAIKFTHTGTVEFGNYLEENSMVFYVKDTGTGIPADRREAIFDRFVQADQSHTRSHEGSGLGLSIVKAYVEALHGKIWVESEVGKGSAFFFSLPYKPVD